jgi:purine-binding chemotaxis protein CheW
MDSSHGPERYLVFSAGGRRVAIAASTVAEVLPLPRLTRPPQAPGLLAGFLNLGGEPLPVLDVARLLDGPAPRPEATAEDIYRHVIRLNRSVAGEASAALLVDRVEAADARAEDEAAVEPDHSVNGVVAAQLRIDGAFVPVLDVSRLLLAEEQARLDALAQAEAARLAELRPNGA